MSQILKNKQLEMHIDLPEENYNLARFDRTGKIVKVKFQDIDISGVERTVREEEQLGGKGFYNEFGIDDALGYEETEPGGWFHKIGVGLLKKDDGPYFFGENYEVKPAEFEFYVHTDKIQINCQSSTINGYGYELKKEITLLESCFIIKYHLLNTGEKAIVTDEYNHNFMAINNDPIGSNYKLVFPFQIMPGLFRETVNPEGKIVIGEKEIEIKSRPREPFFFSNLSGGESVTAGWELINHKCHIGIRETGSFLSSKINLWGCGHVISPELFFKIETQPGESTEWSRMYEVFEVK